MHPSGTGYHPLARANPDAVTVVLDGVPPRRSSFGSALLPNPGLLVDTGYGFCGRASFDEPSLVALTRCTSRGLSIGDVWFLSDLRRRMGTAALHDLAYSWVGLGRGCIQAKV